MKFFSAMLGLLLLGAAPLQSAVVAPFFLGADLSFANEMQDCGAKFRLGGKPIDPFVLIKRKGGNLARIRIWNSSTRTRYSDLADVERSIRRAKAAGLQVLLDFHYSDDWADGDKQYAPVAWAKLDTAGQGRALHDYTRQILDRLAAAKLLPELVQVGNEINHGLLSGTATQVDWPRNAILLQAGLRAVRESAAAAGKPIVTMLHVAQPENAEPWFAAAAAAGVTDYDMIGLSYYKKWSAEPITGLTATIARLRARYGKSVVLVETAYPHTIAPARGGGNNLLGPDSLDPAYPATPQGQARYMMDITRAVFDAGGDGVVYWAPEWIPSSCTTPNSAPANWENATWFDGEHRWEVLPVVEYLSARRR